MIDVFLQSVWVLYRINKDEGDESLPLPAFRRDVVNAIFMKYSKEGRLSRVMLEFEISHQIFVMMTQNITRYDVENKASVRCTSRTLDVAR